MSWVQESAFLFSAPSLQRLPLATLASVALAGLSAQPALALETRSYVMSSFWHAGYNQDGDCPDGLNLPIKEQYEKILADFGYGKEEIAELIAGFVEGEEGGWDQDKVGQLMTMRGRVNGRPVSAYSHPAAVKDSELISYNGKFAYGFDLDGKGQNDKSFVDPETQQVGIDHQLARVWGCTEGMRDKVNQGSATWLFFWTAAKEVAPAWTITISGEDLSNDGPITIKFGRALEPTRYNGDGSPRSSMTFRADPDPRVNNNIYPGQIREGVISITKPGPYYNVQEPLLAPRFSFKNFNTRLKIMPDGTLEGIIGGYQPIEEIYWTCSSNNYNCEIFFFYDIPGHYHLLKKHADADPDPVTGQNWSISAVYSLKAVPAFVVEMPKTDNQRVSAR